MSETLADPREPLAVAPPGRWAARLGGLPRSFWVLWWGTLVNRLGSFIEPFLALYLTRSRGFSLGEAGLVLTAFGLGSAISQPTGGVLADRVGRRRTAAGGLASTAVALLVLGAATTLPALLVAALVYGLCLDLVRPAVQAAVADLVPEADRPRAYALNFWAINLGFSVAVPLGGALAAHGYWTLFVLDALTGLAFAGIVLRGVPETRPVRAAHEDPGSVRDVLRDRLLLGLVASVVLQAVVYLQVFTTLPVVVVRDGLGAGGFGLVLGLNGLLIIALQPLLIGPLAARDRGRLLLGSSVLVGAGLGLHSLAGSLPTHAAAVVVWTTGEVLQAGFLTAVVAELAPVHLRGRYMGAFGFSFGLAGTLAPLLGTQVLEHLGERWLGAGCVLVATASGVGLLRVSRAAAVRAADRTAVSPGPGRLDAAGVGAATGSPAPSAGAAAPARTPPAA